MRYLALCALLLLPAMPSTAYAQAAEIHGKYSTQASLCKDKAMQVFEIHKGFVGGADFNCTIANEHVVGNLWNFDAKCTQGDKKKSGTLSLDVRDEPSRIKLSLPVKQDWIVMHRCY
jgi:hypothetical protein